MSGQHDHVDSSLSRRAFLAASAVGAAGMALSASSALAAKPQDPPDGGGKLQGKKVALVVAHEFEDIELYYPVVRFAEEGANVVVATLDDLDGQFGTRPYWREKPITGRFGATVPFFVLAPGVIHTQTTVTELKTKVLNDEIDALVFPGGFSPDFLRINANTLDMVAWQYSHGKVVAAICHGPWVLISTDSNRGTDIVRGREVTGYVAIKDDMINAGGIWRGELGAVRRGNVVTGRVPDDLAEFCREVVKAVRHES